jgi:hypothetical protein
MPDECPMQDDVLASHSVLDTITQIASSVAVDGV